MSDQQPNPASSLAVYPKIRGLSEEVFPYLHQHLNYRARSILGSGGYGTVVRATRFNPDASEGEPEEEFAVKTITSFQVRHDPRRTGQHPREIMYSYLIDHPNCVRVYEIVFMHGAYVMIMELCSNGSLLDHLNEYLIVPKRKAFKAWVRQIGAGLRYLHVDLEIAHRDLKLENILLDHEYVAKIGDYGTLKTDLSVYPAHHTRCGTGPYVAPEIYFGQRYDPYKADSWSFGITMFILATRKFPFMTPPHERIDSDTRTLIHSRITSMIKYVKAQEVLMKTLEPRIEMRIGVAELLEMELFKPTFSG